MLDKIFQIFCIIKDYFEGPGFKHLRNWLWFGLFFALLPVIISWIILSLGYGHTNYDELALDGLLAVIAVNGSVCAGVFEYGDKMGVSLMNRAVLCFVIAMVGAGVYTAVSSSDFIVPESSPFIFYGALTILIIDFLIELSVSIRAHRDFKKNDGEKCEE